MNNVVWLGDEEEAKLPTISFHTNFINVQAGFASFIHYFVRKPACPAYNKGKYRVIWVFATT